MEPAGLRLEAIMLGQKHVFLLSLKSSSISLGSELNYLSTFFKKATRYSLEFML